MNPPVHPDLVCIAHRLPATHVIEYHVPVAGLNPGDTEKRFVLVHDDDPAACFGAEWDGIPRSQRAQAYPLTQRDAEEISGIDLGEAA